MRLISFVVLGLAVTSLAGCDSDEITTAERPPLAGVRIINALAQGQAVDVKAVDQIEWSPEANGLAYRGATIHYPTEAKARHLRVFPTSTDIAVTSVPLLDTTITFEANTRVTLILTGSVAANTERFVVITDDITPPPAGQIGVRVVNASTTAIDAGVVNAVADPLPSPRTFAGVGPLAASPYINRPSGSVAVRTALAGSATVAASAVGPTAAAATPGALPGAGINTPLTKFSVYYFPAITAIAASQGRPAVAATAASLVWLIDRNPAD